MCFVGILPLSEPISQKATKETEVSVDGRSKPSFSVKERGSNGAFTLFAVFCLKSLVNAPAWCSHGAVRRPRWVKSSPDAPQGRGYSIYEMASGRKKGPACA